MKPFTITYADGWTETVSTYQGVSRLQSFANSGEKRNAICIANRRIAAAVLLQAGWYTEQEAEHAISDLSLEVLPV